MKLIINWILLCSVLSSCNLKNYAVEAKTIVKRRVNSGDMKFGHMETSKSDTSKEILFGIAGQKIETNKEISGQAIGYANFGGRSRPVFTYDGKAEVGLYRAAGKMKDVFNTNENSTEYNGNFEIKAFTAGLEAGAGLMGSGVMARASLFDATVNTGPIGFSTGIGVDTGAKADLKGVEIKYLGIGGKISTSGIQVCFIICLGINW